MRSQTMPTAAADEHKLGAMRRLRRVVSLAVRPGQQHRARRRRGLPLWMLGQQEQEIGAFCDLEFLESCIYGEWKLFLTYVDFDPIWPKKRKNLTKIFDKKLKF